MNRVQDCSWTQGVKHFGNWQLVADTLAGRVFILNYLETINWKTSGTRMNIRCFHWLLAVQPPSLLHRENLLLWQMASRVQRWASQQHIHTVVSKSPKRQCNPSRLLFLCVCVHVCAQCSLWMPWSVFWALVNLSISSCLNWSHTSISVFFLFVLLLFFSISHSV